MEARALSRFVDEDVHVVGDGRVDLDRKDRGRDRPNLAVELWQVLDRLDGAGQRRAFEVAVGLNLAEDGDQLLFQCGGIHGCLLHPTHGKIFLRYRRVKPGASRQFGKQCQAMR